MALPFGEMASGLVRKLEKLYALDKTNSGG